MAYAKVNTKEIIVEEDGGVFQHTTERISVLSKEKCKRDEDDPVESPSKYIHTSDGNRSSRVTTKEDSLKVPFWKNINRRDSSFHFRSNEIGSFSILRQINDKECFEDQRYRRIYKYPFQTLNVNFDLKIGESDYSAEPKSENIDPMLWWLSKHKQDIFKNNRFTFDFLCWRGVLRLIMFTIFEKHSDWLIGVIKFKNAYFICEYATDMQLKDEQNMTPEHRSFCYYGHKFEEYVTKNDTSTETINPSKQFTGVFQSTIGSYRLLYGAEMDCVIEHSSSKPEHIELKVCAGKTINDLPFQYNRKFAKWWIQCFLVGIKTMIIGLRDNNGIVNILTPLSISDIEQKTQTWSRQSFFNFFLLFANFLKEHVTTEYSLDHKDVVLFHFVPSSQKITVTKSSNPKYHFLRDWFYNEFS